MNNTKDDDRLDLVFHALANRTRRALLAQLAERPNRVNALAAPHDMSVAAVSKHLMVLERAGLISRQTDGNVQTCVFELPAMAAADDWLSAYRHFWTGQLDGIARFLENDGDT